MGAGFRVEIGSFYLKGYAGVLGKKWECSKNVRLWNDHPTAGRGLQKGPFFGRSDQQESASCSSRCRALTSSRAKRAPVAVKNHLGICSSSQGRCAPGSSLKRVQSMEKPFTLNRKSLSASRTKDSWRDSLLALVSWPAMM